MIWYHSGPGPPAADQEAQAQNGAAVGNPPSTVQAVCTLWGCMLSCSTACVIGAQAIDRTGGQSGPCVIWYAAPHQPQVQQHQTSSTRL